MNKKSFVFIIGTIFIIFALAISTIWYIYDFRIEQSREYYESKLLELEKEIDRIKVKDK